MPKTKAIGLVSGGLDSMLALRVMVEQGIAVKAINFQTPFFTVPLQEIDAKQREISNTDPTSTVLAYSLSIGCEAETVDLSNDYLQMLHNPRWGYGRNVNPCVDCHAFMFNEARQIMENDGASFVFTGEVLGQRPKSQMMQELKLIARRSGLEDRILRPLSAKLMASTLPELEGWVNRDELYGFQGRTRKPQIELAAKFGIAEFPTPAGGCILTDPGYARKVKDLWEYKDKQSLIWSDYNLLRIGRHLRIKPDLKVVVGRHEKDNEMLEGFVLGRIGIELKDDPGPLVIIDGLSDDPEDIALAAGICIRYSKLRNSDCEVAVNIYRDGKTDTISVKPLKSSEVEDWVIT
ncbi:MAG: tRNA (5-methylaminomethyl-2-thiouridylate)-methyltransferase [Calditrichaeota bacterium]|nr:tRNA (5-methylaminomethyl-2-thiouridylate)-methyltransferase [Calditrichota bacterium]